jgi:hypothetical protein
MVEGTAKETGKRFLLRSLKTNSFRIGPKKGCQWPFFEFDVCWQNCSLSL